MCPTVEELRRNALKERLKNGNKCERDAYALIVELEKQVKELKNKFHSVI